MRLGIDIDGVLADYNTSIKRFIDTFHPEVDYEEHCKRYYKEGRGFPGIHSDFVERVGLMSLDPFSEAVETLRYLSKVGGHRICLITNRLHSKLVSPAIDTVRWLHDKEIPYHELHLLPSGVSKGVVSCDFYLDDSPLGIKKLLRGGYEAFLLQNEFNNDDDIPANHKGTWAGAKRRLTGDR